MAYRVLLSSAAESQLKKLDRAIARRVRDRIDALATEPRAAGTVKLTNEDLYRVRAGDIRIVYAIQDDRLLVLVIRIAKRDEVYSR